MDNKVKRTAKGTIFNEKSDVIMLFFMGVKKYCIFGARF